MRRALTALVAVAVLSGGALAVAQSDVFDPQAIAARERAQLLGAKQQSAEAMARSTRLEAQADGKRTRMCEIMRFESGRQVHGEALHGVPAEEGTP